MKRILGVVSYLLAGVIAIFVTLLLLLQTLTAVGLAKSNGKEPSARSNLFLLVRGDAHNLFDQAGA